jgi:DUF1680 family protein
MLALILLASQKTSIIFVKTPPLTGEHKFNVSNRAPLAPIPLLKLPVGSVQANGWLGEYLKRQRSGMTGQLPKISQWLKKDGNAWLQKDGSGKAGWEEVPYWLKGYISLAYQLHDKDMIDEAQSWIEAAIASQRPNGDFGPLQMIDENSRDFWGNMLMLECLCTYYEATGDQRVILMMTKYFEFQNTIPDKYFLTGYWQHVRGGDNLASIYWLYNMTGNPVLLEVAEKNHRCTLNWSVKDTLPDWHNVNVAQSFDEPGIYSQQSKNPANLKSAYANFETIRKMYGQVPGGMFGADENARKGFSDPRQAVETCGMVEQMLSDEELLAISGDVKWADHCENVAFNTYPAAVTPDFTALRYLTSPNMATSDADNHAPGYQNSGPMTAFNPLSHRCCQHNHSQGWPYFSEHLWMASNDDGLVATLYSASTVTAKVGSGAKVTIKETSNYPFDDTIKFNVNPGKEPNRFPIYLRLPQWCNNPSLKIDGHETSWSTNSLGYVRVERTWKAGDTISLKLPMAISATKWTANHDSMSLNYGPLTFSLKITEEVSKMDSPKTALGDSEWQKDLDTSKWPAYSYMPKTPWNVALAIDPNKPLTGLTVVKKDWPKSGFPFTPNEVPIYISVRGAVLPEWKFDRTGLVSPLQQSPTRSFQPIQTWKLIPMGAARLRITAFPWLAPHGQAWTPAPKPSPYAPKASHVFGGDTIDALCDNVLPSSSDDETVPRLTFWDHKGTQEWVEYSFAQPKSITSTEVYWFDDSGHGGCRVPKSWKVFGKVGDQWLPMPTSSEPGVLKDRFNSVTVGPVKVTGLRLMIQLQDRYSAGILEWRVK